MKSNEAILKEWISSENNPYYHEDDALGAMKEAQVEAIKELAKRNHDNFWQSMFPGSITKSVDEIALELIKEIES